MAKYVAMEATITVDEDIRVVHVTVEHGKAQSYSRAVLPKAKKAFKSWLSENVVFGDPCLVMSDFGVMDTEDGSRTYSIIHFSY